MVLKHRKILDAADALFENDVKMYGTQTSMSWGEEQKKFENDVKMYGTQTRSYGYRRICLFENDVKMYGTQTSLSFPLPAVCLRMM